MERLKGMRFALGTLFLLAGAAAPAAPAPPQQAAGLAASPSPSPTPRPSPSPSPTPAAKLLPYWYETEAQRSAGPFLRFEDRTEVRALEMNMAIARYFDPVDEKGDMQRGATPGGAPTLDEMKAYRPHVSPSADLTALAFWAIHGLKDGFGGVRKTRVERNEELLRALLLASAETTPTPSTGATPSPTPTPR
jgi:hypothetical protein